MIEFTCPYCEAKFKVADDLAGRSVRCRECRERIDIPSASRARAAGGGRRDRDEDEEEDERPPQRGRYRIRSRHDDDYDRPKRMGVGGVLCLIVWIFAIFGVMTVYGQFSAGMDRADTVMQQAVVGVKAAVELIAGYILARALQGIVRAARGD